METKEIWFRFTLGWGGWGGGSSISGRANEDRSEHISEGDLVCKTPNQNHPTLTKIGKIVTPQRNEDERTWAGITKRKLSAKGMNLAYVPPRIKIGEIVVHLLQEDVEGVRLENGIVTLYCILWVTHLQLKL